MINLVMQAYNKVGKALVVATHSVVLEALVTFLEIFLVVAIQNQTIEAQTFDMI